MVGIEFIFKKFAKFRKNTKLRNNTVESKDSRVFIRFILTAAYSSQSVELLDFTRF